MSGVLERVDGAEVVDVHLQRVPVRVRPPRHGKAVLLEDRLEKDAQGAVVAGMHGRENMVQRLVAQAGGEEA